MKPIVENILDMVEDRCCMKYRLHQYGSCSLQTSVGDIVRKKTILNEA